MRIAVLGAGRIGAVHARNLLDDKRVATVVVADPAGSIPDGAESAPSAEAAVDGADGVVVATPTAMHPDHVALAARVGVPVFCEKPISLDLATTRATLHAVAAANVELVMGFQRRYDPGFAEMHRLLRSGDLGDLLVLRAASHDHEPPHESYLPTAGSIFRDMHIHDFDALPWLADSEVESVHAVGSVLVDDMFARNDDVDVCAVTLRFANGVVGSITGTRAQGLGYDHRTEAIGTRDAVCAGFGPRMPLRSVDPDGPQSVDPFPTFPERFAPAYRAEMQGFVDLVDGSGPNRSPGESAYAALRLAIAADRSLATGAPVRVADVT